MQVNINDITGAGQDNSDGGGSSTRSSNGGSSTSVMPVHAITFTLLSGNFTNYRISLCFEQFKVCILVVKTICKYVSIHIGFIDLISLDQFSRLCQYNSCFRTCFS